MQYVGDYHGEPVLFKIRFRYDWKSESINIIIIILIAHY